MKYELATLEFACDVLISYKHRNHADWEVRPEAFGGAGGIWGIAPYLSDDRVTNSHVLLTAHEAVIIATDYLRQNNRVAIADTDKAIADIKARATSFSCGNRGELPVGPVFRRGPAWWGCGKD